MLSVIAALLGILGAMTLRAAAPPEPPAGDPPAAPSAVSPTFSPAPPRAAAPAPSTVPAESPRAPRTPVARPAVVVESERLPTDPTVVGGCLVTAEYQDVPAQEAGRLVELKAKEGDSIKAKDVLAQIDDKHSNVARAVAEWKLKAATTEASNDINVRYAKKNQEVSQANLDGLREANATLKGAIPGYEMREAILKVEASKLQEEQARHELKIAAVKASVQQSELEAADLDIERRKVTADMDAVVEKKYRVVGDWVKPGDPIYQVIQMDRLKVEGAVDATKLAPQVLKGKAITFTVLLPGGRPATFQGRIIHTSEKVEGDRRFVVKAEVLNKQEDGYWMLKPGLVGQMKIHLEAAGR
jgi:multidrug efflux pump subunit AcrA (membrane-fusion protein)